MVCKLQKTDVMLHIKSVSMKSTVVLKLYRVHNKPEDSNKALVYNWNTYLVVTFLVWCCLCSQYNFVLCMCLRWHVGRWGTGWRGSLYMLG